MDHDTAIERWTFFSMCMLGLLNEFVAVPGLCMYTVYGLHIVYIHYYIWLFIHYVFLYVFLYVLYIFFLQS